MEVTAKAEALAKKALHRSALEKQAAAERKVAAWQKIQKSQPTMATLIADCGRVFGKPAAIKVEIEGDIILNQGEFAPAKRFFNGKLR